MQLFMDAMSSTRKQDMRNIFQGAPCIPSMEIGYKCEDIINSKYTAAV